MTPANDKLVRLAADTIRGLAMDAVQQANSGHPGMPMGMADAASVLWTRFLRYSVVDPEWPGRDRFVLSAGHGSMLLYALLHLSGHPLSIDDLKRFRQLHSRTPGHPEHGETVGVDTTTGPLGAGFGNGVGFALAARMEAARFGREALANRVFGIVSDGDLMEGVATEAASLAGHWKLDNLVYLYDDNQITIEGATSLAFSEDVRVRFAGLGWRVFACDGHDLEQVQAALEQAVVPSGQPTLIQCRTTIGRGSPNKAGTHEVHGAPLGADEVAKAKAALGLPAEAFHVPDAVRDLFAARAEANERVRATWLATEAKWRDADPARAQRHAAFRERHVPAQLFEALVAAAGDKPAATRALSGKVIQKAAELVPSLVTGSADLDPSTKTRITSAPSVQASDFSGRTIHYGIREHAMGGILNGIALHGGFLPAGSTFLVFSDYMRPPIRLAALMKLRTTFVFTHDSLMVGEDGPTHQPVEHVAALRLIPNLDVFRPADGVETAAAWTHALTRTDGPTALILTRQDLPVLARTNGAPKADALRGAYVVHEPAKPANAIVIATGAEVAPTIEAVNSLAGDGIHARVVSMPCVELFLRQDEAYRSRVLQTGLPVAAVEMGRPEPWCRFTGSIDRVHGQSTFGASAPAKALTEHFGWTPAAIAKALRAGFGSLAAR